MTLKRYGPESDSWMVPIWAVLESTSPDLDILDMRVNFTLLFKDPQLKAGDRRLLCNEFTNLALHERKAAAEMLDEEMIIPRVYRRHASEIADTTENCRALARETGSGLAEGLEKLAGEALLLVNGGNGREPLKRIPHEELKERNLQLKIVLGHDLSGGERVRVLDPAWLVGNAVVNKMRILESLMGGGLLTADQDEDVMLGLRQIAEGKVPVPSGQA